MALTNDLRQLLKDAEYGPARDMLAANVTYTASCSCGRRLGERIPSLKAAEVIADQHSTTVLQEAR